MITVKWTTLTHDCNKFAGIVEEHARLNGENDLTWLARCYKSFENYFYAFTHYEALEVLKNHHKWRGVKAFAPGRRVRTAEDIEEPNELFRGHTIPRPPDKPRPNKSLKCDSSRSTRSSSTGGDAFKEMVQEELRIKREKNWIFSMHKKNRGIEVY
ncbi:hypothetical protein Tco_1210337 [Tanacetum coccineum]